MQCSCCCSAVVGCLYCVTPALQLLLQCLSRSHPHPHPHPRTCSRRSHPKAPYCSHSAPAPAAFFVAISGSGSGATIVTIDDFIFCFLIFPIPLTPAHLFFSLRFFVVFFLCLSLSLSLCLPWLTSPLPLLLCALSFKRIKLSLDFCCQPPIPCPPSTSSPFWLLSSCPQQYGQAAMPTTSSSEPLEEQHRLVFQHRLSIKRCSRPQVSQMVTAAAGQDHRHTDTQTL